MSDSERKSKKKHDLGTGEPSQREYSSIRTMLDLFIDRQEVMNYCFVQLRDPFIGGEL